MLGEHAIDVELDDQVSNRAREEGGSGGVDGGSGFGVVEDRGAF